MWKSNAVHWPVIVEPSTYRVNMSPVMFEVSPWTGANPSQALSIILQLLATPNFTFSSGAYIYYNNNYLSNRVNFQIANFFLYSQYDTVKYINHCHIITFIYSTIKKSSITTIYLHHKNVTTLVTQHTEPPSQWDSITSIFGNYFLIWLECD